MTKVKNESHLNAGLRHLERLSNENIRHHKHEIAQTDHQMLAVERDYADHCQAHAVSFRNLDGLEHAVVPIESFEDTANHYLIGAFIGLIVSIGLGTWFAAKTIVTDSIVLLLLATAIIAGVVSGGACLVFHRFFKAKPKNPAGMRNVDVVMMVSGVVFFILLGGFAWCRFNSDSWLAEYLPIMMVGMELSSMIFAGAAECGYRVYRWSGRLHGIYRKLADRKAQHENSLAEEEVTLAELQERNSNQLGKAVSATADTAPNATTAPLPAKPYPIQSQTKQEENHHATSEVFT